jgi:SAM-dependent methyltransferase
MNNPILSALSRLGLRKAYWHLKRTRLPIEQALGYKGCLEFFKMESRYRRMIVAESDPVRRFVIQAKAYDDIADLLDRLAPQLKELQPDQSLFEEFNEFFQGAVVLDFGCAVGSNTIAIAGRARYTVGVDISLKLVKAAGEKCGRSDRLEFLCLQGRRLPFHDHTFDVVLAKDVVEHLVEDDFSFLCSEIRRILKPHGRGVFITPDGERGPHDTTIYFHPVDPDRKCQGLHIREYTEPEITEFLVSKGFEVTRSILRGHDIILLVRV